MRSNKYQTAFLVGHENDKIIQSVIKIHEKLADDGSLFVLWNHTYNNGFLSNSFLEIIGDVIKHSFYYINTIIVPKEVSDNSKRLKHNVQYLLWFAKSINNLKFNKDVIREKHIWKDVEWGRRTKNYNPIGKDPGNVWIPTKDDGKGRIVDHIILDLETVIERCFKSTTSQSDYVLISAPGNIQINIKKLSNKKIDLVRSAQSTAKLAQKLFGHQVHFNTTIKPNETSGTVIFESSEKMRTIKSKSIDLMVTSPPYWNLKDYFKKGEIGQENYSQYLARINNVWKETYRVLKNDGNMFININIRVKAKQPILIPLDIIKQCKKIGFRLVDIVVWHKSSGIPTHNKNIVNRHEYVLWFAKSKDYKCNDYFIDKIEDYTRKELNYGLLWNLNRKAGSVGSNFIHPAIYPLSLTDRIIKLVTAEGDSVLDPFLGSGTTLISALRLGRNSMNYEYNENFDKLIKYRLAKENIKIKKIQFIYPSCKGHAAPFQIFRKKKEKANIMVGNYNTIV